MTKSRFLLAAAALVAATSAQALPTTWSFGAPGSATLTTTNGLYFGAGNATQPVGFQQGPTGTNLHAQGFNYSGIQPLNIGLSTVFTSQILRQDALGLGIAGDTETNQIDSNGALELMKITLGGNWSLKSIVLSSVEQDDTLNLYGLTMDGTLERIGFGGVNTMIWPAGTEDIMDVSGVTVSCAGNAGTCTLTNLNTAYYSEFWFATNKTGTDGYRLNSITAEVPEPAMIGLFGLGFAGLIAARRRAR